MAFWQRFSIDVFKKEFVSGWCYSRVQKTKAVPLELVDNGCVISNCVANIYREDLAAQKIHPTGKCGFTFFLPDDIEWNVSGNLIIRIQGSSKKLVELAKDRVEQPVSVTKKNPLSYLFKERKPPLKHPVFFLHVPKTAGTSFNTFVKNNFDTRSITHAEAYNEQSLHNMVGKYDYVSGHLRIDRFCEVFADDRYRWMTILREPYSHFHSHLNWLRGVAANEESDFYKKHNVTFKQLADNLKNRQKLMPEQLQELLDNLDSSMYPILENYQTRYLVSGYRDRVAEQDTEEALMNLNRFYGVGVTERFSDFQQFFLQLNDAKIKPALRSMNKAKLEPLFDHKDPVYREVLAPFVKSDCILYEKVLKSL